jgi:hypothetical protein
VLTWLRRIGLRKGLVGGNRAWLYVGLVAGGLRYAAAALRRDEEVLTTERLGPGESISVRNLGRPPKGVKIRREKPQGRPKASHGREKGA